MLILTLAVGAVVGAVATLAALAVLDEARGEPMCQTCPSEEARFTVCVHCAAAAADEARESGRWQREPTRQKIARLRRSNES